MKILSGSPYVTEILESLEVLDSLSASVSGSLAELDKRTVVFERDKLESQIAESKPDIVIVEKDSDEAFCFDAELSEAYKPLTGKPIKAYVFNPKTFAGVCAAFEELGKLVNKKDRGHKFSNMLEAEFKNWSDNFYARMKNKKVVVLSSVEPLTAAGLWVPDMINLCSAVSSTMLQVSGKEHAEVGWEQIRAYKPDVILVAPEGVPLEDALSAFKVMEKLPGWDELPAVKRGEVFFTDGHIHFYRPTLKLRESMGILVSAIAGFDSGYITPRDSFQRLRWLEMQRHKF